MILMDPRDFKELKELKEVLAPKDHKGKVVLKVGKV